MKQLKISNLEFRIQTSQTPYGVMIDIFRKDEDYSPVMVLTSLEFSYLMDAINQFAKKVSKKDAKTSDRSNK